MKPRRFKNFEATGNTQRVCFNGWDGKSYNGETEELPTYILSESLRKRMINGNRLFVPKYTRKWGWTMHVVQFEWPLSQENPVPTTDFYCEVKEIKD